MFWVYVLRSEATGRRYTGSCVDLDRRFHEHNSGQNTSTRHGVPWVLIHRESFQARSDAYAREMYLKSGRGREELERLLGKARDAAG